MKKTTKENKKALAKDFRNVIKWVSIALLLVFGIFLNFYYKEIPNGIRASIDLLGFCILFALFLWTSEGRKVNAFLLSSRNELKYVTWIKREEAVRLTFLIVAIVLIMMMVLWAIDAFLMSFIKSIL